MLTVCEIFQSIQGESSHAGKPCVFVRLTGCNLSCNYCDAVYTRFEGAPHSIEEIVDEVLEYGWPLVEITGGEPLLQLQTPELCRALLEHGRTVMVETNGSLDIGSLPRKVIRVVDVKCPGSGEGGSFAINNIGLLTAHDELKFVLSDRADFDWASAFVNEHSLCDRCTVLFSPVWGRVHPAALAEWILQHRLPVRLGLQVHKVIWGDERGR
jgi:7-carboxy-7-deazaguanine synthase